MHSTPNPLNTPAEELRFFLTDKQAADLFGTSRTTFRKLVTQRKMPQPIKFGNCARWERGALLDAAASLQRRGIVAGGSGNE
jgi:predicted DNA-binding transcriptional regulator AlpA